MEEENKEEVTSNPPTKEEIVDAIRNAFKDSEEGLKLVDNILSNFVELKRLESNNPGSTSFRMWLVFMMFLFGMPGFEQPLWGVKPEEREKDETDKIQL